jgi:hypothetical protein
MRTPFPALPVQVAALTVQEFTAALDLTEAPTLDDVCARFADDANRALVWLVRYRALTTFRENAKVGVWLTSRACPTRDLYEIAASLALNERWEFDPVAFCAAVDRLAARRR